MSVENPNPSSREESDLGSFGLATAVGGALWWFGFDGASIAAAAASTALMAHGASLAESRRTVTGSDTDRETGRNMVGFGLGSAIGYFYFSDSAAGYFIGAAAGFLLSAVPNLVNRQSTRPNFKP